MTPREQVLNHLDQLGIPYTLQEHPAVFTIEEMQQLGICQRGEVCKNLFLRDQKGKRHFLVVLPAAKRADLEVLRNQLESSKLSFASAKRLGTYLGLHQGEVTPMGVLNDQLAQVEVAFDEDLQQHPLLGVHPNDNTATLWMTFPDILRVVQEHGNPVRMIHLPGESV